MPAAFGSGKPRDERQEQRRAAAEAAAAREAREARERREAEAAAAARYAEATNFTSEEAYPTLGGGAAAAPKPVMNFKQKIVELREREAAEAREAALQAAEQGRRAATRLEAYVPRASRWTHTGEDDAPPDEPESENEEEHYEAEHQEMAYAGDDAEDDEDGDEEFNANIHQGRRRGDKGVW
jgi:hypothetical protein